MKPIFHDRHGKVGHKTSVHVRQTPVRERDRNGERERGCRDRDRNGERERCRVAINQSTCACRCTYPSYMTDGLASLQHPLVSQGVSAHWDGCCNRHDERECPPCTETYPTARAESKTTTDIPAFVNLRAAQMPPAPAPITATRIVFELSKLVPA